MNANDKFEILASLFYYDTGYLRPGKDYPMLGGGGDKAILENRQVAWDAWIRSDRPLLCALTKIHSLQEVMEDEHE